MKRIFKFLLIFIIVSSLLFPSLAEDNNSLTIAFTHDMHDNLEPFNIKVDNNKTDD